MFSAVPFPICIVHRPPEGHVISQYVYVIVSHTAHINSCSCAAVAKDHQKLSRSGAQMSRQIAVKGRSVHKIIIIINKLPNAKHTGRIIKRILSLCECFSVYTKYFAPRNAKNSLRPACV